MQQEKPMKVKFTIPPGALVEVKLRSGNNKVLRNEDIESIEVEPFFSLANGQAEVIHGEVTTAAGSEVDKFGLMASGTSGKVTRRERVGKIVPLIDKPKTNVPLGQKGAA